MIPLLPYTQETRLSFIPEVNIVLKEFDNFLDNVFFCYMGAIQ